MIAVYGATATREPRWLPALSASNARAIGPARTDGSGRRATSRAAEPRARRSTAMPIDASARAISVSAVAAGLRLPPNATSAESAPRSATVTRSTARSTTTPPTARPNEEPPFCLSSQARYTSPIFAGRITLTQKESARISTAARREMSIPVVPSSTRQRSPRTTNVPRHAASAAASAGASAPPIVRPTCARSKLLAAFQSATRSSTVNAKARSVDGRVARSRMLNVDPVRLMRRTRSPAGCADFRAPRSAA